METFLKELQEQVTDLYGIMSPWALLSLLMQICHQPSYTFKPHHSPKQGDALSGSCLPRQTCDWSLSAEAVSCLWFVWLWHLSSGCHSYELGLPRSGSYCLVTLLSWPLILTATPVPACCDGLALPHFGFFLGSSLIPIKVIHKQPTLSRALFHFLSG